MINNKEFAKRLKIVLEYYQLSAAAFAEKIKVQRSTISHLLSGRNKPSLDFVLKVLKEFNEVELYWFLNGKGLFPKSDIDTSNSMKYDTPTLFSQESKSLESKITPTNDDDSKLIKGLQSIDINDEIDKIVIFYKNGTFKKYISK